MSAPPLSGISLLPALSVVLGLPLCHSNNSPVASGGVGVGDNGNIDGRSTDRAISPSPSSSASEGGRSSTCAKIKSTTTTTTTTTTSSSSSARRQKREEEFAQRAKNNASRIYARRVINRARLERQHPWASSSSSSSLSLSS
mmetsp:Transcript_25132/g.45287  ORF Transcript_25132/g.45287 Transcript_25132/m.45287 type:complete len:142 (-) Transcript_25132:180-605(-)